MRHVLVTAEPNFRKGPYMILSVPLPTVQSIPSRSEAKYSSVAHSTSGELRARFSTGDLMGVTGSGAIRLCITRPRQLWPRVTGSSAIRLCNIDEWAHAVLVTGEPTVKN